MAKGIGKPCAGEWIEVPPDIGHSVAPDHPGVYAFLDRFGAVYIGSSVSLRARLSSYDIRPRYSPGYFTPWGQFRSLRLKIKCSERYGDWLMWEARLIKKLQPRCNRKGVARDNRVEFEEHCIHLAGEDTLSMDEWRDAHVDQEIVA